MREFGLYTDMHAYIPTRIHAHIHRHMHAVLLPPATVTASVYRAVSAQTGPSRCALFRGAPQSEAPIACATLRSQAPAARKDLSPIFTLGKAQVPTPTQPCSDRRVILRGDDQTRPQTRTPRVRGTEGEVSELVGSA